MGIKDWLETRQAAVKNSHPTIKAETRTDPSSLISQDLMEAVDAAIKGHSPVEHVLYSEGSQFIDVVGESFRADAFQTLKAKYQVNGSDEEINVWFSGVLLPEDNNRYDANATMVVILDREGRKGGYTPIHVGYLPKEVAKRVHPQLVKLLRQEKLIPLLIRVNGGTSAKPDYGVSARAKTSAIHF